MYKFTNGIVCYDEATRDKYIKSGMILVKEEPKEVKKNVKEDIQNKVEPEEFGRFEKRTSRFGRSIK